MVMDQQKHHLETLTEIRALMEQSSRFISLSGLSGVAAGIFALLGAGAVYWYLGITPFYGKKSYYVLANTITQGGIHYLTFFLIDAAVVLILALGSGIFFTTRKARRKGLKMWDASSRRLLINMAIPLVAGGIFCLGLLYHNLFGMVAPATLVFYGLACLNASKYTLNDIRNLGILEIILGLIALFYIGYGLEFWAFGFGVLHIVYGLIMYYKYEQ